MITAPELPNCKLLHSGKVRDVYEYQNDKLFIVATDRISAFDYILSPLVTDKGKILHKISMFWFDFVPNVIQPRRGTEQIKPHTLIALLTYLTNSFISPLP